MKKEDIKTWINALRSGDYKQCSGKLYDPSVDGYCCLGVMIHELHEGYWAYDRGEWAIDGRVRFPPSEILRGVGLNFGVASRLADFNDSGWDFSKIADWIEANIETLTNSTLML